MVFWVGSRPVSWSGSMFRIRTSSWSCSWSSSRSWSCSRSGSWSVSWSGRV